MRASALNAVVIIVIGFSTALLQRCLPLTVMECRGRGAANIRPRHTHTHTHNLHYNTHERVCMRVCVCVSAQSNIVLIAIVRLKLFTTATDFQRPK